MKRLLSYLITLLTPILLLLGGARLLMTETFVRFEYARPDFPADSFGFTTADRLAYAPYAVRYLVNNAPLSYLGDLRLPDGAPLFNERELKHMHDVQIVVQYAMAGLVIAGALFAAAALTLARSPDGRGWLRRGLFGGGLLMLFLLGSLLVYILLDWDHFFTAFHNLFFAEGTWRFYYTDSLIRLFPIRFWQDAALLLGGIAAIGALLLIAGSALWARRAGRQRVPEAI